MFNKIRFFIKKLKIKESEYNELVYKSNTFEKMLSCIKVNINSDSVYVTNKDSKQLLRFDSARNCVVSFKVKDILNAAGLEFDKLVKFDIDTNMD